MPMWTPRHSESLRVRWRPRDLAMTKAMWRSRGLEWVMV